MAQQWAEMNKARRTQTEKWDLIAMISSLEQSIEAHKAALENIPVILHNAAFELR